MAQPSNYQDIHVNGLRSNLLVGKADALDLPSTQGSPLIYSFCRSIAKDRRLSNSSSGTNYYDLQK
jgi:hypothetical protein